MVVRRRAFSLAEILVGVALIGVLSAVLVSQYNDFIEKARIARIERTLQALMIALREFNRNVGVFPEDLKNLSEKPTTSNNNICKTKFLQTEVDKWRGPYIAYPITDPGIIIETDTIATNLKRKPANSLATGDEGDIQIFLNNATTETATIIQRDLDGDNSLSAGNIQWNANSGQPRMILAMPMSGC